VDRMAGGTRAFRGLLQLGATRSLSSAGASSRSFLAGACSSSLVQHHTFPALAADVARRTSSATFAHWPRRGLSSGAAATAEAPASEAEVAEHQVSSPFYPLPNFSALFHLWSAVSLTVGCVCVCRTRQHRSWRGTWGHRRGGERIGLRSCTSRRSTLRSQHRDHSLARAQIRNHELCADAAAASALLYLLSLPLLLHYVSSVLSTGLLLQPLVASLWRAESWRICAGGRVRVRVFAAPRRASRSAYRTRGAPAQEPQAFYSTAFAARQ
jgi:hypothetical protein